MAIWISMAALAACGRAPGAVPLEQPADPYALVIVSVFNDEGRAFSGVDVVMAPLDRIGDERAGEPLRQRSSATGESIFRIPPGPSRWEITLRADGFRPGRRDIEVFGDERVDVNVMLEREE